MKRGIGLTLALTAATVAGGCGSSMSHENGVTITPPVAARPAAAPAEAAPAPAAAPAPPRRPAATVPPRPRPRARGGHFYVLGDSEAEEVIGFGKLPAKAAVHGWRWLKSDSAHCAQPLSTPSGTYKDPCDDPPRKAFSTLEQARHDARLIRTADAVIIIAGVNTIGSKPSRTPSQATLDHQTEAVYKAVQAAHPGVEEYWFTAYLPRNPAGVARLNTAIRRTGAHIVNWNAVAAPHFRASCEPQLIHPCADGALVEADLAVAALQAG